MTYEFNESVSASELKTETSDTKLSSFQNDIFVDNPLHKDLMPKIRFTTDASEAAKADRSNPFNLPDSVFYVSPKEGGDANVGDKKVTDTSNFQNDTYNIKVEKLEQDSSSSDYYGPSTESLDIKIEIATKDLTFAQLQLENAIESGTGVMTAMELVESAQKIVDTYVEQRSEAVMSEAKQATAENYAKSDSGDEAKLGSVKSAEMELEWAYNSGNKTRIHNAEKNLAHETAKEKSKEMG